MVACVFFPPLLSACLALVLSLSFFVVHSNIHSVQSFKKANNKRRHSIGRSEHCLFYSSFLCSLFFFLCCITKHITQFTPFPSIQNNNKKNNNRQTIALCSSLLFPFCLSSLVSLLHSLFSLSFSHIHTLLSRIDYTVCFCFISVQAIRFFSFIIAPLSPLPHFLSFSFFFFYLLLSLLFLSFLSPIPSSFSLTLFLSRVSLFPH